MKSYLLSAGVLAFVVGCIYSVLGERLIFCRMRTRGFIPTNGRQLLRESHVRILWATWYALTAMGWGLAAILVFYALPARPGSVPTAVGLVAHRPAATTPAVEVGRHSGTP